MTRLRIGSRVLLGIAVWSLWGWVGVAEAQAPAQLPVQGYLTDNAGVPTEGEWTVSFRIYDVSTGGEPLFTETQSVMVEAGYFVAYIGDVSSLDLTLFRDHADLWVELVIGDETLSPRLPLATTPYSAYSEYAGEVPWSGVTNPPAGLADGDDDTTYTAGTGLTLDGTEFSVDSATVQSRVNRACPPGSAIRSISATGTVSCETDNNTTYAAGVGLSLSGTTFAANTGVLQARVAGTCPAGSSIRAIAANGTVVCETDNAGTGDITGIATAAASGLVGGCTSGTCSLAVDPTAIHGAEPAGSTHAAGTLSLDSSTAWSTLLTVTVTAPVAGYVVLIGAATVSCVGCSATNPEAFGVIGWDNNETGTPANLVTLESRYVRGSLSSRSRGTTLRALPAPRGTSTFYLRGRNVGDTVAYAQRTGTFMFTPN